MNFINILFFGNLIYMQRWSSLYFALVKPSQALLVQKQNDEDSGTAFLLSFRTAAGTTWEWQAQIGT